VAPSRDEAGRRQASYYGTVLAAANALLEDGDETRGLARFDEDRQQIVRGYEWAASSAERLEAAAELCSRYPYDGELVVYLRLSAQQRIEWCQNSAVAATRIGDRGLEAAHLHKLAMAYLDIGEIEHALPKEERALAINREIERPEYEASCLGGMGLLHAARGDHQQAIDFYEQALAVYATIDAPWGEGIYWSNLGDSYTAIGEPRKAISVHERALRLNRQVKDRRSEGYTLGNLGKAYAALGEQRKAISLFAQQLTLAEELEDMQSKGYARLGMSRALAEVGDHAAALTQARQALTALEEFGDPRAEECRSHVRLLEDAA
jgi:tetratricopeptide (TPR) repeat protein